SRPMRRRLALTLTAGFGTLVLYLLLWPVPIHPVAFRPPSPPALAGIYATNHRLAAARSIGASLPGPEDVAFDARGHLYTGLRDGRILRAPLDGSAPEVFANTQGRPLGIAFDQAGDLIVADAERGLLSVTRDGSVRVLATEAEGRPIAFAN